MQPWLDLDGREKGCRRCRRALRAGDVHIWACRERTRKLDFDRGVALVRYEEVSRARPVCGACLAALERGSSLASAGLPGLLLLAAGVAALWIAGGPVAHHWAPAFASAFYRDGSAGR